MIVAICILGGLLLLSIFVIGALWYALGKLMDEYIDKNPKEMMGYYFKHYAEESYPCTLLLAIKEGADFDGSIYDFSKYEESNIIGLTEYKTTTESNGKYEDYDGEPITALLPNQKIYKMKDGSYTWDFRNLL